MGKVIGHVGKYLYALAGGVYLYTAGPFVPRHRRMLTEVAQHFGYRRKRGPRARLPEVALDDLAPSCIEFRLLEPEARDGNVSLYELIAIARLVRLVRPARSFEIGTFNGRTTLNIAANSPPGAIIHTLDLPAPAVSQAHLPLDVEDVKYVVKPRSGELFADTEYASRIQQLYGDSACFDGTPFRGAVDFVFVDGSHAYEYVQNDSQRALEMLRGGTGTILWHDYAGWEGVTRALNELYESGGVWSGLRHIRGTSLAHLRLERGRAV